VRRRDVVRLGGCLLGLTGINLPGADASGCSYAADEQGRWGDLVLRVKYEGEPPKPKPIKVTVDCEYCGVKERLFEERLVVNKTNMGVQWVVGWLMPTPGHQLRIHEIYKEKEAGLVELSSTNCRIVPHVQTLRTTQTLLVRNTDPIRDGIKIDPFINQPVNVMMGPKSSLRFKFPVMEPLPAHVACPVHPWESGWLVIKEHPYVGVSDANGKLQIRNIPSGKWVFQFWHEASRFISRPVVNGKTAKWNRGRVYIDIEPGINDLGTIVLPEEIFRLRS